VTGRKKNGNRNRKTPTIIVLSSVMRKTVSFLDFISPIKFTTAFRLITKTARKNTAQNEVLLIRKKIAHQQITPIMPSPMIV
jgi:hypothetical protein